MVLKIFGGLLTVIGFFMLVGAPGDRAQMRSYGNTGRLLGIILMVVGILLIKL
jgi:hypothetical protein